MIYPQPIFRFQAATHSYVYEGHERPHTTSLLRAAGLVDDRWYTPESRLRGQAVHQLTAAYDLDALCAETLVSPYRGYVLGYVAAMQVIPHTWERIEEPRMHPVWLFGTRTDRVGQIYGQQGVIEIKSGAEHRAHHIQTALQVIAESYGHPVPRESWWRGGLYVTPNGKWKLVQFTSRRDFDDADRILREHCPSPRIVPATVAAETRSRAVSDRRRSDRDRAAVGDRRASARRVASERSA